MEDYFVAVQGNPVLAEHISNANKIQILPTVPSETDGKIGDVVIVL